MNISGPDHIININSVFMVSVVVLQCYRSYDPLNQWFFYVILM